MLVKILPRGKGGGDAPVNYLLGKPELIKDNGEIVRTREQAKLLRGNAEITKELINSTDYARRYTSGCLSFEENNEVITQEMKDKIMNDFEKTLFPGLDPDQYNILWVEHADKAQKDKHGNIVRDEKGEVVRRLELNFLIPNQELRTGKRLQPYYHAADLKRINAFQNVVNLGFGLSDPHDPAKHRITKRHFKGSQSLESKQEKDYTQKEKVQTKRQQIENDITEYAYSLAERGALSSRSAIKKFIEEQGYEVTKMTKKSMSINHADLNKPIRLKDPIFSEDFKAFDYIPVGRQKKIDEYKANKANIFKESLEVLNKGIEIKSAYHKSRFAVSTEQPVPVEPQHEHVQDRAIRNDNLDSNNFSL